MHPPHPRELTETRAAGWSGRPRPDHRQGRSRTARGPPPPPKRRRRRGEGANGTPKGPPHRGGRQHGQLTGCNGDTTRVARARVKGRTHRRLAAARQGARRWMRIRDRSRADTIAAASRPTPIPRTWSLAARERTEEESSSGRRQRSTAEHEIPKSNDERAEPRCTDGCATSEHGTPKGHDKACSAGPRGTIQSPRARGGITERTGTGDGDRGQGERDQPGKGAPSKVRRRTAA